MQQDDAMITKKYVGPVDCASCEKGIINLNGLRSEQVNWNRLPFRDPSDRIARVSVMITYLVRLRIQQVPTGYNELSNTVNYRHTANNI